MHPNFFLSDSRLFRWAEKIMVFAEISKKKIPSHRKLRIPARDFSFSRCAKQL
jgi:hypothetical protein